MRDISVGKVRYIFLVTLISICCLAWYIQQQLFLSWDISSLLLSTSKLLAGGNYIKDFFIPNPPMILYLYIPPLLAAKFLQIDVLIIFPIYIFLLAVLSYAFCYHLIKKIFKPKDYLQQYLFATMIAVIFLIVPVYEFGQRDHLLMLLSMPYLLITVCRAEEKMIKPSLAISVGLLAGIGIAIKPQFIILPLLIETYYLWITRKWMAWFKAETITIIAVIAIYLSVVVITRQDYIKIIMPYLIKNYYGTALTTWFGFLFVDPMLYVYSVCVFHLFTYKFNEYRLLGAVLWVALVAFTLSYLAQGFTYYYHMVPALALALLWVTQMYANIFAQAQSPGKIDRAIAIPAICMLLMQAFLFNIRFSLILIDPAIFFVVVATALASFFLLIKMIQSRLAIVVTLVITSTAYFISIMTWSNMPYYLEMVITLVMWGVFSRVAFAKKTSQLMQNCFTALLGVALFAPPAWIVCNAFEVGMQYKESTLNKLIDFMHTQLPHSSIYMLATGIHFTFPMASYTDVVVAQRFDALWMVRGFIKDIVNSKEQALRENIRSNTDKNFVINMVVEDLNRFKPQLVFVEANYSGQRSFTFNFLEYFLESKPFRQVWQNYHYYTTVEQAGTFKLEVYKLNDSAGKIATNPAQAQPDLTNH